MGTPTKNGKDRNTGTVPRNKRRHYLPERGAKRSGARLPASHKELEVILMRQLADCLGMPIFIVDVRGTLVFYNEPAELLLGQRFEESGELTTAQWARAFAPMDHRGRPLPPAKLPLVIALRERRPGHADFQIRGLDKVRRRIQVTAFPLVGRANRSLGAVAIFWEVPKP